MWKTSHFSQETGDLQYEALPRIFSSSSIARCIKIEKQSRLRTRVLRNIRKSQAETWARRKAALEKTTAHVNEYECDESRLEGHTILRFPNPDERWVRFVCDYRRGGDEFKKYELIIGGVANDKVYYAVDMFYQELWDIKTTLKALRYYEVNDQWCFVSQSLIGDTLRFVRASEVDAL